MAEARDPLPPESGVVVSSTSEEEHYRRRCLFRHQLFFMLGVFLFVMGSLFLGFALGGKIAALVVTIGVALSWTLSGVYAIEGRRHMFAGMKSWGYGNVVVRPSRSSATGAIVVGVILVLLGVLGWGSLAFFVAVS